MINRQKTSFNIKVYTESGEADLHALCNGFTIKNTGTTNLFSLNDLLLPGESKTFGCNAYEVISLIVDLVFKAPAVAPPVSVNSATVTQKIFID